MNVSRRDLGLLLPMLASRAVAQQAADRMLSTKVYHNDKIPLEEFAAFLFLIARE
jgi:hypothetical protein